MVLQAIHTLFFPPICTLCKEVHREGIGICDRCKSLIEWIPEEGRCHTCFREKRVGEYGCSYCKKHRFYYLKYRALFYPFGTSLLLERHKELYSKEIAYFFLYRYLEVALGEIAGVCFADSCLFMRHDIKKLFSLPLIDKKSICSGKTILYLSMQEKEELPLYVIDTKIYQISYFFQEN